MPWIGFDLDLEEEEEDDDDTEDPETEDGWLLRSFTVASHCVASAWERALKAIRSSVRRHPVPRIPNSFTCDVCTSPDPEADSHFSPTTESISCPPSQIIYVQNRRSWAAKTILTIMDIVILRVVLGIGVEFCTSKVYYFAHSSTNARENPTSKNPEPKNPQGKYPTKPKAQNPKPKSKIQNPGPREPRRGIFHRVVHLPRHLQVHVPQDGVFHASGGRHDLTRDQPSLDPRE